MKPFWFGKQRVLLGRLNRGDDILQELTGFCVKEQIHAGSIQAIGAVERAAIGYYDQVTSSYKEIHLDRPMEIASLTGNISQKEDQPFLHCHFVLADEQGRCLGGHLLPGTRAFACEFAICVLDGTAPIRTPDETTGLSLW